MKLVISSSDGMRYFAGGVYGGKSGYTRKDLGRKAARLEADGWDISWDGPNAFEATHDGSAAAKWYQLVPDKHPHVNGEPCGART